MTRRTEGLLPPKRAEDGSPYRVAIVCLGNICRSPIGEVVLTEKLERAGLAHRVEVVSAGTGTWHIGEPIDRRAATVLAANGYDPSQHRAAKIEAQWPDQYDLTLAMDEDNHADLRDLSEGETTRLRMFRDFDPRATNGDRGVPDPYFGGDDGFAHVLATVERTCDEIVAALEQHLGGD